VANSLPPAIFTAKKLAGKISWKYCYF